MNFNCKIFREIVNTLLKLILQKPRQVMPNWFTLYIALQSGKKEIVALTKQKKFRQINSLVNTYVAFTKVLLNVWKQRRINSHSEKKFVKPTTRQFTKIL